MKLCEEHEIDYDVCPVCYELDAINTTPTLDDVWLTIPTGGRSQYLDSIIEASGIPRSRVVIVNTVLQAGLLGCHNLWTEEFNIQHWWNLGINHAQANGAKYVVVVNDDVRLGEGAVLDLVKVMKLAGSWLGTKADEGPCGWFYVLNLESPVRPDESYVWWYGDNDLYEQASGHVLRMNLDVEHLHGNELTEANPMLKELTERDLWTWVSRHQ